MNTPQRRGLDKVASLGWVFAIMLLIIEISVAHAQERPTKVAGEDGRPYLVVLGIAQDAGYPQAGCRKACCVRAWRETRLKRHVACLAIVDPQTKQRWFVDCTPDFREQLRKLDAIAPPRNSVGVDGVLLTHAHIGHYSGLMQLGREVMGTRDVPVYVMPRMKRFLASSGPWNQLVTARNIQLRDLADGAPLKLNERIRVTPFLVPHRDEYSETVGFRIQGPSRTAVYLPDIDKWDRWETDIDGVIRSADVAYLDGTFYANGELPGRDMSKIPHPFIAESLQRFAKLPESERGKVRFLHFNHTNPVLDPRSRAADRVRESGCRVAREGERFELY